ncbi:hypothetical protein KAR91_80955 [Candidatus Pacearchaeota archaeon]|nr:hypothetical protein [Candidatus Pacearchaeota archaeon]
MAYNYYIFDTEAEAKDKSAKIYDLYVTQPVSERTTLYAYPIFTNNTDYAMAYDGSFDARGLLDGLTPITEQQAIDQGYNLDNPIE